MGDDTDYTHDISRYCNLTIVRVSGDDTFRNPSTINIAVVSSRYDKIKVGLKLCQSAAWPDQWVSPKLATIRWLGGQRMHHFVVGLFAGEVIEE